MSRMRWKKWKPETGLRAVGAGPYRPSDLHDGQAVYATVYPMGGNWRGPLTGWYWVTHTDIGLPHQNTCGAPSATEAEAKDGAKAFVLQHINRGTK